MCGVYLLLCIGENEHQKKGVGTFTSLFIIGPNKFVCNCTKGQRRSWLEKYLSNFFGHAQSGDAILEGGLGAAAAAAAAAAEDVARSLSENEGKRSGGFRREKKLHRGKTGDSFRVSLCI